MKVLGRTSFKQLIFDDFEETLLAASVLIDPENDQVEAPHHARYKISKEMDGFIRRVADVKFSGHFHTARGSQYQHFLDIYVFLCMNRSRLRRLLCHLVLEWETIELEVCRTLASSWTPLTECSDGDR